MLKKIFKTMLLIVCLANLLFAIKPNTFAATKKKADEIVLSKKSITMEVNEKIIIGYEKDADIVVKVNTSKKNEDVVITSKDDEKIKIENTEDNNIKITAIKSGDVKVKIMLDGNKKVSKTLKIKILSKKKKAFGKVIKVTGKNFNKEVLKAKGKVIVDYGAKWCGYCQLLKPIYKEAAKIRGLYKFTDVDADEEEELIESQGIESFPTLHLYENGKLIKVGGYMMNMTVWDLIDWIESK
nr:protein disulfide isomerase family protein [uncultured Catonella sp.]